MNDAKRIQQLLEDAGQVLAIAQQLLDTVYSHSQVAIQSRDRQIAELRQQIKALQKESDTAARNSSLAVV